MRQWIESPLYDAARITSRQQAVGTLVGDSRLRTELGEALKKITDLERILSRIEVGSANARDMASLRTALLAVPDLKRLLAPIGMGSWQSFPPALTVMKPS